VFDEGGADIAVAARKELIENASPAHRQGLHQRFAMSWSAPAAYSVLIRISTRRLTGS
jgi:hypothetical protein